MGAPRRELECRLMAMMRCGDEWLPREMVFTEEDAAQAAADFEAHCAQYGPHDPYVDCGAWCGVAEDGA